MANILIVGAFDTYDDRKQEFIRHVAAEVVKKGHTLINGCCNEFDRLVAKSAFDYLNETGVNPKTRMVGYAKNNASPVHEYGTVLRSRLETWGLEYATLLPPEPIEKADVVVIVGGKEGTLCAANWARIAGKPLLPVTTFGGAGEKLFEEELKEFEKKYAEYIDITDYEVLNQVSTNLQEIAADVISLAGKINVPRHVLAVMSFAERPELEDAYESFKFVCSEFDYHCERVDDSNTTDRILPEIFAGIKRAAFVIVDLTEERANVYYELGYATGLGKSVVVTAHKGTTLPFDVKDIPTIFWESQKVLKEKLKEKIAVIATGHGR